jgi:hypothetical protein
VFASAMLLVGQHASPGLVRTMVDLARRPRVAARLATNVARARVAGLRSGFRARSAAGKRRVTRKSTPDCLHASPDQDPECSRSQRWP